MMSVPSKRNFNLQTTKAIIARNEDVAQTEIEPKTDIRKSTIKQHIKMDIDGKQMIVVG